MRLPLQLHESLEKTLNTTIQEVRPCFGGDINTAAQIITPDHRFFLKWNVHAVPMMFRAEAQGLQILRTADKLRVPEVIAVQEATADCPAYLVLEWLEADKRDDSTYEKLGVGLAMLHQIHQAEHGLDHDNFIGSLPQSNSPSPSWVVFYGEQRLRGPMEIARQRGYLSDGREKNLQKLIQKLPDLIPEVAPSLLHGDLWGGNVMFLAESMPALIDPAVYYGHREVEIAFTQLFGGFSAEFYNAYQSVYPLDQGYHERRALYQLYPLLVHMNLFGGGYISQVDTILKRYVG